MMIEKGSPSSDDGVGLLLSDPLSSTTTTPKRSRRPLLNLIVLLLLLAASTAGIPLSLSLIHTLPSSTSPTPGASLAPYLLLASSSIGILYVLTHVAGAVRNNRRARNGPPQMFGNYLHTGAMLLGRVGLFAWLGTGVTALVVVVRGGGGLGGGAAVMCGLTLLDSLVAFASSVLIACSIESNTHPFATALISRRAILTGDELLADEIGPYSSVSRQSSLLRRSGSVRSDASVEVHHTIPGGGGPRRQSSVVGGSSGMYEYRGLPSRPKATAAVGGGSRHHHWRPAVSTVASTGHSGEDLSRSSWCTSRGEERPTAAAPTHAASTRSSSSYASSSHYSSGPPASTTLTSVGSPGVRAPSPSVISTAQIFSLGKPELITVTSASKGKGRDVAGKAADVTYSPATFVGGYGYSSVMDSPLPERPGLAIIM